MTPHRQTGRTGRYVRSCHLEVGPSAPVHRLAFLAEESLRLCSLPGEEEGRIYFFRRLQVYDLPEDGDRRRWLESFQQALRAQASQAVHGGHPAASRQDAVFFHNELEACEITLTAILTRRSAAWFWPHITGVPAQSPPAAAVTAVIERLLRSPSSWTAVSATVFSIVRKTSSIALLALLPAETVSHWLRQAGADRAAALPHPIRFPEPIIRAIRQAMQSFGPDSPHALWLAVLAVVTISPSTARAGAAVFTARASLRAMVQEADRDRAAKVAAESRIREVRSLPEKGSQERIESPTTQTEERLTTESMLPDAPSPAREEICLGEPTSGAGLYFLLNALSRLGVAEQHFSVLFLASLFLHIARYTGIEAGDPILLWAEIVESESEPEQTNQRLLRLWSIKIRRWCWKNGRIRIGEIVRRPGYITLTRTDLDVSLSIDSADIRIRRIGLDLNPGWLPWFGRVVRFHYNYRGDARA